MNVSTFDTDGEFLLIEAAEVLPSWVSPQNSENRVRTLFHTGKVFPEVIYISMHIIIGLDIQIPAPPHTNLTHLFAIYQAS